MGCETIQCILVVRCLCSLVCSIRPRPVIFSNASFSSPSFSSVSFHILLFLLPCICLFCVSLIGLILPLPALQLRRRSCFVRASCARSFPSNAFALVISRFSFPSLFSSSFHLICLISCFIFIGFCTIPAQPIPNHSRGSAPQPLTELSIPVLLFEHNCKEQIYLQACHLVSSSSAALDCNLCSC
jgi:hypothetical protein